MSELKVNKISPRDGTAFTLGDSGDTFTVPTGANIVNSGTATGFGGGAWTFLSSATASASTSLDFTSLMSSTYDTYVLKFTEILPATLGGDLYVQLSTDNGATWKSTNGYKHHSSRLMNASAAYAGIRGETAGIVVGTDVGFGTLGNLSGECVLTDMNSGAGESGYFMSTSYKNNSGNDEVFFNGAGRAAHGATYTACRVIMTSGNITSGEVQFYGISKS